MPTQSLMAQALDEQWSRLPPALQAHYQRGSNTDKGTMDIEYPLFMQPYLTFMRLFGALINRRGKNVQTSVKKWTHENIQHWNRTMHFSDNKKIVFKSFWIHPGGNELIEYVNSFIGLRMEVCVKQEQLHYSGKHYVLKLGKTLLPIPEWLVLGHTTIIETALDDEHFAMDFRLTHPLLGELFRYAGTFQTTCYTKLTASANNTYKSVN